MKETEKVKTKANNKKREDTGGRESEKTQKQPANKIFHIKLNLPIH